jgi:predicted transcriptional regulator
MAAMTLRLDDEDSEALRRQAEQEGRSMQQLMHDALHEYLERTAASGWAEVASRPALFAASRSEIDEAIRASDLDWPGQ